MKINLLVFLSFNFLLFQACSKGQEQEKPDIKDTLVVTKPPTDIDTVPQAGYDISLLEKCLVFNDKPVVVNLARQDYQELSGLTASQAYPGVLYIHEDSGNTNEVFVINTRGEDLGKIVLDGVSNRDWEDIAYGPGPDPGKKYIYLAEIGDNDAVYSGISIYRFPEPELAVNSAQNVIHVKPDKLQFVYPKGPLNAESLLLDPATKDLYIVTKEVSHSTLYVARYPQSATVVTTLVPLVKLSFDLLTSGDISADGTEILLRNTGQIWYWKRLPNETVAHAMLRQPQDAPYARNEHQGEGICFTADGTGYLTLSEVKKFPGDLSALSFYQRK
jgi:hypothetical protein